MNNIALPPLGQGFGQNLSEVFGDISSNFQELVNLFNMYRLNPNSIDFLTINLDFNGDTDDTLFLEFCKYTQLEPEDASDTYSCIILFLKNKIASAVTGASTSSITGTIALAVSPNPQFIKGGSADADGGNFPITIAYTLPYIVSLTVDGSVESHIVLGNGYTSDQNVCILNLRQSSDFPYIKLVDGQYVWVLNGQVTNIPAQGAAGANGNPAITVNAHHRESVGETRDMFAYNTFGIITITGYPTHTAVLVSVEEEPAVFYISEIDSDGHILCNKRQQIRPYWAYVYGGVSEPDLRWGNQYSESVNPNGWWEYVNTLINDHYVKYAKVRDSSLLDWLDDTDTETVGIQLFRGNNGLVWKYNGTTAYAWILDDLITHDILYLSFTKANDEWTIDNKRELTPGYYRVNDPEATDKQRLQNLLILGDLALNNNVKVRTHPGAVYLGIDPARLGADEREGWDAYYYYDGSTFANVANIEKLIQGHREIAFPTEFKYIHSHYATFDGNQYIVDSAHYNPGHVFGVSPDDNSQFSVSDLSTWTDVNKVKYIMSYIMSRYIGSSSDGPAIRKFRYGSYNGVAWSWDTSDMHVSVTSNSSVLNLGGQSNHQQANNNTDWILPASIDIVAGNTQIYGDIALKIGDLIQSGNTSPAYQIDIQTSGQFEDVIWSEYLLFDVDILSSNLIFKGVDGKNTYECILKATSSIQNNELVTSLTTTPLDVEIWPMVADPRGEDYIEYMSKYYARCNDFTHAISDENILHYIVVARGNAAGVQCRLEKIGGSDPDWRVQNINAGDWSFDPSNNLYFRLFTYTGVSYPGDYYIESTVMGDVCGSRKQAVAYFNIPDTES